MALHSHNVRMVGMPGYWEQTDFLKKESEASGEITFYDTITAKPLFV